MDPQLAAINSIADISTAIINPIIKLLMAAAVIYFLWGVVDYLGHREDEDKKKHLLWGLIGIAITISAFGIVNLIHSFVEDVGTGETRATGGNPVNFGQEDFTQGI